MAAATKILFCAVPVNGALVQQGADQAVWRPVPGWPEGLGWIDWFGFMGQCDPDTGIWTKVPAATPGPHNAVFFDGVKLYSQPNFDFVKGTAVGTPAPGFFYLVGALGAAA